MPVTCWVKVRRSLLAALVTLVLQVPARAQEKVPFILGGAWQQGSVIIHTPKIRHLAGSYPAGLELNLQVQTQGKQYWQQVYRYPRIGLSLVYLDYRNLVIGRSLALSPYLSLPVREREKSRLHFRFGTGLAYFSNTFHPEENPGNNIISARYNAVIQTRLEYEHLLNPRLAVLGGLGIHHYSNGGSTKPNLGINTATASLGLNFYTQPEAPRHRSEAPEPGRLNAITLSSSLGLKQRNDHDPNTYKVYAVALGMLHRLNDKSTLAAGLEGFYDASLFPRRAWDPRVAPGTTPDIRRVALNLGHELNFGKLAFGTHLGYYFYRPYKADAPIYQRLETRYYVHRHLFMAAGLKLHDVIKADVIEYRLGLRI